MKSALATQFAPYSESKDPQGVNGKYWEENNSGPLIHVPAKQGPRSVCLSSIDPCGCVCVRVFVDDGLFQHL